jgi:lysophospholipase L1-like esterase
MKMWLVTALAIVACSGPAAVATPSPSVSPTESPRPPSASPTPTPTSPATARPSGVIHYVAIGASDTVGVGALDPIRGSWPSRVAALLPAGSTYTNLGVSGSLTAQAATEQLPGAIGERPTIVSIWLAVNDMNAGVSPEDHAAALARIVDGLASGTDARIFVGNVPDLRAVPAYADTDPELLAALVNGYNDGIARVARRHGDRVVLVDLHTGSAELMTDVTVAQDGFHPSDAGYILIADRFAAAMRSSGIALEGD